MVRSEIATPQSKQPGGLANLAYLESRLRQEADAAASAVSMEASLAHLGVATQYADCFAECSGQSVDAAGQAWVNEHRLW
jgi:hypothetical protein